MKNVKVIILVLYTSVCPYRQFLVWTEFLNLHPSL